MPGSGETTFAFIAIPVTWICDVAYSSWPPITSLAGSPETRAATSKILYPRVWTVLSKYAVILCSLLRCVLRKIASTWNFASWQPWLVFSCVSGYYLDYENGAVRNVTQGYIQIQNSKKKKMNHEQRAAVSLNLLLKVCNINEIFRTFLLV